MRNLIPKLPELPDKINWFPGHMHKALKELEKKTADVDIFLEIRDARLPYSTRNAEFDTIIRKAQKKKIIIFNKIDLCDQTRTKKIIDDYNRLGIHCYYMSAKTHENMKNLMEYIKSNLPLKYKTVGIWLMICGMPNVGKSTIINQIRSVSDLENRKGNAKFQLSDCEGHSHGLHNQKSHRHQDQQQPFRLSGRLARCDDPEQYHR
jgi:ribosome biogenesis GTPase A